MKAWPVRGAVALLLLGATAALSVQTVPAGPGTTIAAGPGTTVAAGPGSRQGLWHTFTPADGLAGFNANSIVQDARGHLWISTSGGLCRYDGSRFTTFTTADGLPHDHIRALYLDRQGGLWFGKDGSPWFGRSPGSSEGVTRYDGQTFTTFTSADGLLPGGVRTIYQDRDGRMWFGGENGVSRYDGQTFAVLTTADGLLPGAVRAIYQDRDGHMWFGFGGWHRGRGSGIARYDGHRVETFADSPITGFVRAILQDLQGRMWFAGADGAVRYDGGTFTTVPSTDMGMASYALSVFEDRDGRLWIGSSGFGVSRYDGESFATFTTTDGLSDGHVQTIFQDRDGQMWFGTLGGIMRYDGGRVEHFARLDDGTPLHYTFALLQDRKDRLLAGGRYGVANPVRFDGRRFVPHVPATDDPSPIVKDMAEDARGRLWLSFRGGRLAYYDGRRLIWVTEVRNSSAEPRNEFANDLLVDGRDRLWFAGDWTAGAPRISRYDGEAWTHFTAADGLRGEWPEALCADRDGRVWFSTSEGVFYFQADTVVAFAAGQQRLQQAEVLEIYQDLRGHYWFSTTDGLVRYDGAHFVDVAPLAGWGGSWVRFISEDRDGRLLFASYGSGLHVYDGQVLQSLTQRDFLTSNGLQEVLADGNGDLWIGSDAGITRYRPSRTPPVVHIRQVVADRAYAADAPLVLSSAQHLVTFELDASSLVHPDGMIHRYRLLGHDAEWRNTHATRVEYQDLPAGDYRFEVQAVDRDLNYSAPATVALEVHPPYERFAWIAALVVALGLVGWQTVRVVRRDRRLRQANVQLAEQNDDLAHARDRAEAANRAKSQFLANMSHEIRTPMNAILGYAQVMERSAELPPAQREAVATIQSSGNHLLSLINEVLDLSKIEAGRMELNPADFDLADLLATLGEMFALRCDEKRLQWRLETVAQPRLPVHGDAAKLSQVLINLLGNAVAFTEGGSVALSVTSLDGDRYRFSVRDTGPGIHAADLARIFEPFEQAAGGPRRGGTGLGLAISQRILQLMDAELDVDTQVGRGSCFSFTIVLPPAHTPPDASDEDRWKSVCHLAPGHSLDVLIVDDVTENRQVLAALLADIGVRLRQVESGRAALAAVRERKPDVVLMDMRMPDMDGVEAAKRLWDEFGSLKVIAISASTLDHERQGYLDAGFDDFLDKPVRAGQLFGALARLTAVEFEFSARETPAATTADFRDVALPADLHARLLEAISTANITRLERDLDDVARLGEQERSLADRLRMLSADFHLQEIRALLVDIDTREP